MNPIKFEKKIVDGIYEFHFHTGYFYPDRDERVIPRSESFISNKVLWNDWASRDGVPQTLLKYGISNGSAVENILLYMLIVWNLAKKEDFLGCCLWETCCVGDTIKKDPIEYVNWQYELTHYERKAGSEIIDDGFKVAQSSSSAYLSNSSSKPCPEDKIGLFEILCFADLVGVTFYGSQADFTGNYYIGPNKVGISSALKSTEMPTKNFYDVCNISISLLVGLDHGYNDYFVIKSKSDISAQIKDSEDKINRFANLYIERIKLVKTSEEMIDLIDNLIAEVL